MKQEKFSNGTNNMNMTEQDIVIEIGGLAPSDTVSKNTPVRRRHCLN